MTSLISVSYQSYRQALVKYASSNNDKIALQYIPNQVNDPEANSPDMWLKTANARALGFNVGNNMDATMSINVGACNLNRVNIDRNK